MDNTLKNVPVPVHHTHDHTHVLDLKKTNCHVKIYLIRRRGRARLKMRLLTRTIICQQVAVKQEYLTGSLCSLLPLPLPLPKISNAFIISDLLSTFGNSPCLRTAIFGSIGRSTKSGAGYFRPWRNFWPIGCSS
jgi:hypothetical protein